MTEPFPTPDDHRTALGFLTAAETIALGADGVRGQVVSLVTSFADAPVENQSAYHPSPAPA